MGRLYFLLRDNNGQSLLRDQKNISCFHPPTNDKLLNVCNFLFRSQRNIEFRDSDNLSRILEVLSLDPKEPYALSSNRHLLYYADWSGLAGCQVKELNCLASPPKLVNQIGIKVDHFVTDMCIASKALITVSAKEVKIYNLDSKALEHSVPDVVPETTKRINSRSVTSNKWGHFFVCNNHCINMYNLNASDKYRGVLLKTGDRGLGEPIQLRWCEKMSSLIVAHKVHGKISISVVKSKRN